MEKTNIDNFLEEYKALTEKYGVDFMAYPQYVPDENGKFYTVVQTIPMETKKKDDLIAKA